MNSEPLSATLEHGKKSFATIMTQCEAKKEIIADALKRAEGNYTVAAKLLGVHPNNCIDESPI